MSKRLDKVVCDVRPDLSRTQVQQIITDGLVIVNGSIITKPGMKIPKESELVINYIQPRYVSRAGLKLEKALSSFQVNVSGLVALDSGLSTGGFTDCLLQHGVTKVYGVDVGSNQVHEKIASDDRVIVMEQTNLKEVTLSELVDIITLDLSFISLTKVIEYVCPLLKDGGCIIALIKPQFEAGRHNIESGGLVSNPLIHQQVLESVKKEFAAQGLFLGHEIIESPILGATSGNKEFLGCFKKS